MLNIRNLTEQIVEHLADDERFAGYKITRSEPVNANPKLAARGWIGVYKSAVTYTPQTLQQADRRFKAVMEFRLVVQRISKFSGEEAEDALEESVRDVCESILEMDKRYLRNFEGFEVEYGFLEGDKTTFSFQVATINYSVEVQE